MKTETDLDAIARKYGGAVGIDDIASRYGATVSEEAPTLRPVKFPGPAAPVQPPVPPLGLGGAAAEFTLGAAEGLGVPLTTGDVTKTLISNIGSGLREAGGAVKEALTPPGLGLPSGTARAQNLLKNVAMAPVAPFKTAYEGVQRGDPAMFARGLGGIVPTTIAAVGTAGKVTRAVGTRLIEGAVPEHIVSSMLGPTEKSFEFGADPVQAVIDVAGQKGGTSWTLQSLKDRVVKAAKAQEQILRDRLKAHRVGSTTAGVGNTYDVTASFKSATDKMIQEAMDEGRKGAAKSLERFQQAQLDYLKRKYGSTALTPDQILDEKRIIGDKVRFSEKSLDPERANLNTSMLGVYRGYDAMLDNILGADMKGVNQRWSGLIEAEKLLDRQMLAYKNSPLLSTQRWRIAGEVAPKTAAVRGMSFMAGERPIPPPGMPNLQPRRLALPAPAAAGGASRGAPPVGGSTATTQMPNLTPSMPPTPTFTPSPGANRLQVTTTPFPKIGTIAGEQAPLMPIQGPLLAESKLAGAYATLPDAAQEFLIELKRRKLWKEGDPLPAEVQPYLPVPPEIFALQVQKSMSAKPRMRLKAGAKKATPVTPPVPPPEEIQF